MKNTKNEIAIIGCGYWGSILAKNLNELSSNKIFLYDNNKKNLKNLNKKIKNTVILKSLNSLIKNKEIKNVILATPPSQNFKITKKLIVNNKNIFIEKPGFIKLKQFNEIIKLSKIFKNLIMVGYVYLYNDYIKKIKNIIDKNKLGKIVFIKSIRENLGPIRTDIDCNFDLASHDLSIISYLLNKKIKYQTSIKHKILNDKNTDISSIQMQSGDVKIEIRTSWLDPEKIRKLIIIGTKKMLVFNEMSKNKLLIYNQYANFPEIKKLNKIIFSKKPKIHKGKFKKINIRESSPVKNELLIFLKCINQKKEPISNLEFSKNIFKILKLTNKN